MKTMTLPTHKTIKAQILSLVESNLKFHGTHSREDLDDIISDLMQYRESLPTCQEYMDLGEL